MSSFLLMTAVAWGAGLRVAEWWTNRSLDLDELSLADSIVTRGFLDLLQPLRHAQGAPGGFLLLTEGLTRFFGTGEMVLRVPALLAGTAGLASFAVLARRWISSGAALVLTLVLAQADAFIYWSTDFKPYSFDVLALSLLASMAGSLFDGTPLRTRSLAILAIAGGLAPWFSVASVFVLPGAATLMLAGKLRHGGLLRWRTLVAVWTVWCAGIGTSYFMILSRISTKAREPYWQDGFIPHSFSGAVEWALSHGAKTLQRCLSCGSPAMPVILVGALTGLWLSRRRPLGAFAIPVLLCILLASWMQMYSVIDRLALFLMPLLLLLLAVALDAGLRRLGEPWKALLIGCIVVVVFGFPLSPTIPSPRARWSGDRRAFVSHASSRILDSDEICGDWSTDVCLGYYAPALRARQRVDRACPAGLPPSATVAWVVRCNVPRESSEDAVRTTAASIQGTGWNQRESIYWRRNNGIAIRYVRDETSPVIPEATTVDTP